MLLNYLLEALDGLSMASVWIAKVLSARKNKFCFVIFSLNGAYWIVRNYYLGLHVAPLCGFVNLAINFYGFYNWTTWVKDK